MNPPVAMPVTSVASPVAMPAPPVQAMPVQAMPAPQPPQMLQVQVPHGVMPGQMITVSAPNGQQVQVSVPAGLMAGQTFTVQLGAPMPAPTIATQPIMVVGAQVLSHFPNVDVWLDSPMLIDSQQPTWAMGAAPGGHMEREQHCGMVTIIIAIFLFPCVCCCPCDQRMVWVDGSGRRFPDPNVPGCDC